MWVPLMAPRSHLGHKSRVLSSGMWRRASRCGAERALELGEQCGMEPLRAPTSRPPVGTALGGSGSTPGVGFARCQAALTRWHPMRDDTCVYFSNIMIQNLIKDWRGDLETSGVRVLLSCRLGAVSRGNRRTRVCPAQ